MRCLLVHDSSQGHSNDLGILPPLLSDPCVVHEVEAPLVPTITDQEFDVIVLWCAVKWWKENKTRIKGRPWICAASWCFDDTTHLTTPGMGQVDAGVHFVITNCLEYVQQSGAAFSTYYALKPLYLSHPSTVALSLFGTVLPNIKDRDFSQLIYTRSYLLAMRDEKYVNENLAIRRTDAAMRVPEILEPYVKTGPLHRLSGFSGIKYFIPAPRITDYRGGVFPPEIYEAVAYEATPLVIKHPVLERQTLSIPLYRNLTEYNAALDLAIEDKLTITRTDNYPTFSTFHQVSHHIKSEHSKWLNYAPNRL